MHLGMIGRAVLSVLGLLTLLSGVIAFLLETETSESGLEIRPLGEGQFGVFDPAPDFEFDERLRGQLDVIYTDPVTRTDLVVFSGSEVQARSYAEDGQQEVYAGTQAETTEYVAEADARLRSFFVPAVIILGGVVLGLLAAIPAPRHERVESPIVMR